MSDQLLAILRLCLLALLYLFFLRVLWAVYAEIRPARAAHEAVPAGVTPAGAPPPRADPVRLVVAQPEDRAGFAFDLADEVTLGRAEGCGVTLDDTFVSQVHARVYRREGTFMVEDLGSTNGTYLNGQQVTAPMPVRSGDRLQVGRYVLEMQ